MQLIEIGDTRVVAIRPDDSIDHAIAQMEQHNFRHLPVVERGRVLGMVSDRDLLRAVGMLRSSERVASSRGPARVGATRVAQVMSTPAITVDAEGPLDSAAEVMLLHNIRAVPLVYKDRLAGIVTETDFLKCYLDDRPIARKHGWRLVKVADHMSHPVITLAPNDSLLHAVKTMNTRKIRHLPIVQGETLVGIVSDRDMRRSIGSLQIEAEDCLAEEHRPPPQVVMEDIMTRDVRTTNLPATLAEVAETLVRNKFGSLPVISDTKLVGIISESDLLRHFLGACRP